MRGVDVDDLVQESIMGLTRAVDEFDWSKGFKFSTYAYWWIQQAIRQCIASNSGPIELPANTFSKLYKVSKFEKSFLQEFGRSPTDEETAAEFGTTTDTLRSLRQSAARPKSFDTPMFSDDSGSRTLKDILPSNAESAEDMIDNMRLAKTIQETLATLTERERTIIMMRFGIEDSEKKNDDA